MHESQTLPMTRSDEAPPPGEHSIPIRTVAKMTGLTPDLIRAWEKRYGVVDPVRGPRGARLYSRADVNRLRMLAQAVGEGRSIGDIAHMGPAELAQLVQPAAPPPAPAASSPNSVEAMLSAVHRLDMNALERSLNDALVGLGSARFARDVAMPLLDRVGKQWLEGKLTIGQEHLVTSALRNLLGALSRSSRDPHAPTILLTSPAGERHELGLLMVSVLAADEGLGVYLLGADIPAEEIVDTALKLRVGAIGLSMVGEANRLSSARALRHLDDTLPPSMEIWLGGGDAHHVAGLVPGSRALLIQNNESLADNLSRYHARRPGA